MVSNISSGDNTISDLGLNRLAQQQGVEKVNKDAATDTSSPDTLSSLDSATISPDAFKAYAAEREIMKFSRLAQRISTPVDYEKVNRIKNMLDSGKINDYLNSIDNSTLVDNILSSPAGKYLSQ